MAGCHGRIRLLPYKKGGGQRENRFSADSFDTSVNRVLDGPHGGNPMLIINVLRAVLAILVGLINTGFWFTLAVLIPLFTGHRPNWPAKGWAWVAHWLIYRVILGVKLKLEVNVPGMYPNETFVVFGNHPPTPALSEWVYGVDQAFPGYFFSPVARSSHPMARGFGGIGGTIINREVGDVAVEELHQAVEHLPYRTVLTIFSDENRLTPTRHKEAWKDVTERGRLHLFGRHRFTMPVRGRGTHALVRALPQGSWIRCTVSFNRPVHLVWDAWRLPGATLLIRFDRVPCPPVEQAACFACLNEHFATMDQIMEDHQEK